MAEPGLFGRIEAWLISSPQAGLTDLARSPLFIVVQEPVGELILRPTRQFWVWTWLGLVLPSVSLNIHWAVPVATAMLSLAVLTLLVRRVRRLSKLEGQIIGQDHFACTPLSGRRRTAVLWLPCSVAVLLSSCCCAAWCLTAPVAPVPSTPLSYLGVGIVLMGLYWSAIRLGAMAMALPQLSRWRRGLPIHWRALVDQATRKPPRHASSTWRSIPDLSREVNGTGTAMALFADSHTSPVWKRSSRYILWYLAPALVPLVALWCAPLVVWAGLGATSFLDGSKLAWGLASMTWASWVLAFFCINGIRDFELPEDRSARAPTLLADMLGLPYRETREKASSYFVGQGGAVFNLMVVAMLPAYMGYLGLFTHAEPPKGDDAAAPPAATASAAAAMPSTGAHPPGQAKPGLPAFQAAPPASVTASATRVTAPTASAASATRPSGAPLSQPAPAATASPPNAAHGASTP